MHTTAFSREPLQLLRHVGSLCRANRRANADTGGTAGLRMRDPCRWPSPLSNLTPAPFFLTSASMSDDEDVELSEEGWEGEGGSEEDEEESAAREERRRQRAEPKGTPFGAGGAKFADAVAKLLAPSAAELEAEGEGPTTRKRAAAGPPAAAPAPILARSRTAATRAEQERAERLRLKAARRHKREVRARERAPAVA